MSKDRLEVIKEIFDIHILQTFSDRETVPFNMKDIEWLIQQAKRVQELEEDLLETVKQNKELRKSIAFYSSESYNAHLERLLDRREQQNKRYREAIEDIKNAWKVTDTYQEYMDTVHDIIKDLEGDLE